MVFRDGANPTGITAVSFIVAISTTETLFASGLAQLSQLGKKS
jgi:hypothetical protein